MPIDNNISARALKRIAPNRKNRLFVGNGRGGRTVAILSSITSTRRHDIDPRRYLRQLLTNRRPRPALAQAAAHLDKTKDSSILIVALQEGIVTGV